MASGPSPSRQTFRVADLEFDARSGELRKQGLKVRLSEQPFQVLLLLLAHPGEVVTRDEMRQRLWPDATFVDFEAGLNSAVRRLREALNDSAEKPRFVETLPRRGYRLIATVEPPVVPAPEKTDTLPARPAERLRLPFWVGPTGVAAVAGLLVALGMMVQWKRPGGSVAPEERSRKQYVTPQHLAVVHLGLGHTENAFALLEEAYEERAFEILGFSGLLFERLRGEPRFQDLLRRMRLPTAAARSGP